MHHPDQWWQDENHPQRKGLLKLIGEVSEDSEDDYGKPKYLRSKCPRYKNLLKKIKKQEQDHEATRKNIKSEN